MARGSGLGLCSGVSLDTPLSGDVGRDMWEGEDIVDRVRLYLPRTKTFMGKVKLHTLFQIVNARVYLSSETGGTKRPGGRFIKSKKVRSSDKNAQNDTKKPYNAISEIYTGSNKSGGYH